MKTLKGVIAASTGKGEVVPDESDLHMAPWYFILSSNEYINEDPPENTGDINNENT